MYNCSQLNKTEKKREFEKNYCEDEGCRTKFGKECCDNNQMNLLHYCILRNHVSTALTLIDYGYGNTLEVQRVYKYKCIDIVNYCWLRAKV